MRAALALARRGLGNTWPNPSVGCVVVKDGRVVGRAVTAPGGRPHAEPAALDMAGTAARRCDGLRHAGALLPLGPHAALHRRPGQRRCGPCGDRHARPGPAGGRRRASPGCAPPASRSTKACCRPRPTNSSPGFRARIRLGRPLVTLKLASTLDGRIATSARRKPLDHRRAPRAARPTRCAAGTTR